MNREEDGFAPDARVQADRVDELTAALRPLLHEYVQSAEGPGTLLSPAGGQPSQGKGTRTAFDHPVPDRLRTLLQLELPESGTGNTGVLQLAERILDNSANTWHQGFLDKLYGSTDPVGVASELLLATLNTNVHVYRVAPSLTVIENTVTKALAARFGFTDAFAGGVSQPGGSGANLTALVIARNSMFPETKTKGSGERKLVLFTSAHGHYSFEKAAQICGLGSEAVRPVPVDAQGQMLGGELARMIQEVRAAGETPFFVNATAGTTVLGSYDPLDELADICRQEGLWLHVDGSWGGSVIFSDAHRHKLHGSGKANSLTVNPHKMLGVPITCSFLLTGDLRRFHNSNTLRAEYLFHDDDSKPRSTPDDSGYEAWDLADLTLQCGRKGDAVKLAMAWVFYGASGFEKRIDHAFSVAEHLTALVEDSADLILVSHNPPACLQVCFYFARDGQLGPQAMTSSQTKRIAEGLLKRDFLVDFAPGKDGLFFRVVVSLNTRQETVDRLAMTIVELGRQGA